MRLFGLFQMFPCISKIFIASQRPSKSTTQILPLQEIPTKKMYPKWPRVKLSESFSGNYLKNLSLLFPQKYLWCLERKGEEGHEEQVTNLSWVRNCQLKFSYFDSQFGAIDIHSRTGRTLCNILLCEAKHWRMIWMKMCCYSFQHITYLNAMMFDLFKRKFEILGLLLKWDFNIEPATFRFKVRPGGHRTVLPHFDIF